MWLTNGDTAVDPDCRSEETLADVRLGEDVATLSKLLLLSVYMLHPFLPLYLRGTVKHQFVAALSEPLERERVANFFGRIACNRSGAGYHARRWALVDAYPGQNLIHLRDD